MMKKIVMVGLAVVVLGAGVLISLQRTQGSSQQQGQMAALTALRDSGAITAPEFDSKVQALEASPPAASATSPASPASQPVHFAKISAATRRVEVTDPNYQITAVTMEIDRKSVV